MRPYLIIAAIVIVILGIGAVGYFYFFRSSSISVGTPNTSTTFPTAGNTSLPTTGTASSSAPVVVSGVAQAVAPRLVEIDKNMTVAGAVAFDVVATTTGTSTAPDIEINYLERESGNVFSYLFDDARLTRISNRTIPGIQEADWTSDGATALVRYLSGSDNATINTYALAANGSGGSFLPQDLTGVSVEGSQVLALSSGANGSIASTGEVSGTLAQVFTTALAQIRAQFFGSDTYLVTTKSSATEGGYAFSVDSAGNFTRIAGPLDGLVALASPLGDWILVSYTDAGVMKMELVNAKTLAVLPLPVATIADKCVWTADEEAIYCGIPINPSASYQYPDDWYQGAVSFSDRIWKIDVTGRFAELTLDFPQATKLALDATNLAVDPKGQVLIFRNKIDGSLWAYQL